MLVICLKISVSDTKINNLSDINLVEETFVKKKKLVEDTALCYVWTDSIQCVISEAFRPKILRGARFNV
jgi:hypothetical protein